RFGGGPGGSGPLRPDARRRTFRRRSRHAGGGSARPRLRGGKRQRQPAAAHFGAGHGSRRVVPHGGGMPSAGAAPLPGARHAGRRLPARDARGCRAGGPSVMAVYKQTYRGYEGAITPEWSRALILYRYALRAVFRSKLLLAFYLLCFI